MSSLSPFTLSDPLGQGAMASVIRAHHNADDLDVAVKVLTANHARDHSFLSAFADEVRSVASLDHPGIITVFDYGHLRADDIPDHLPQLVEGSPFLVMELAPGGTLENLGDTFYWSDFRSIMLQLLDALAHAHARGLIHRDIKPANVLRFAEDDGFIVKLADFGISHAMGRSIDVDDLVICGTPLYMAPEQFTSEIHRLGPWTDLYALGCLAFELLTGRPPFQDNTAFALYNAHCEAPRPALDLDADSVPARLDHWIHRLMAPAVADRFLHAADAAWALLNLPIPRCPHIPLRQDSTPDQLSSPTTADLTLASDTPLLEFHLIEPLPQPTPDADPTPPAWRPPFPATWREPNERPRFRHLSGVGAGLYGLRPIPLAGRLTERDALWNALRDAVTHHRPGVVVLRGPAGCGKSRLASWLAHRAAELGAAHYAIAYHSELPGPVEPIPSMLRRLLLTPGDDTASVLIQLPSTLHQLPDPDRRLLATLIAGDGDASDIAAVDRLRLFARAIINSTRPRPLILWFDDVQWGAEALAIAQRFAAAGVDSAPLLFVLTVREDALATRPDEDILLTELQAQSSVITLSIGPLDEGSHLDLVSSLLGLDQSLSRQLAQRTDGNPLFALELVGDWIAQGLLQAGADGFTLTTDTPPPLPNDLFHLWNDRIEHVVAADDPLRQNAYTAALELAALLGRSVSYQEWSLAYQYAYPDLPRLLDELLHLLLDLRLASRTPQGFSFIHGMLRESLIRRSQHGDHTPELHRTCARVIESLYPENSAGRAERLALHLREARLFGAASRQALRAAEECVNRSEFHRALELINEATTCLNAAGRSLEDPAHDAIDLVHIDILHQLLRHDEVRHRALALLERARRLKRTSSQAHAREALARLNRRDGNYSAAATDFQAALAFFEDQNDRRSMARCLEGIAWMTVNIGDLSAATEYYHRVLTLLPEPSGKDIKIVGDSLNGLAEIARRRGDISTAITWLDRTESLARKTGNARILADALNSRGELLREAGDFDGAEKYYRQTADIMAELGATNTLIFRINLGAVYLGRGDYHQALHTFSTVAEEHPFLPHDYVSIFIEVCLTAATAGVGNWPQARQRFATNLAILQQYPPLDPDSAFGLEVLARLATDADHLDIAHHCWKFIAQIWHHLDNPSRAQDADQKARITHPDAL